MEKLVLALVIAAKRPRRYFEAHPIVDHATAVKGQILADFSWKKPGNDAVHLPPVRIHFRTAHWNSLATYHTWRSYDALIAGIALSSEWVSYPRSGPSRSSRALIDSPLGKFLGVTTKKVDALIKNQSTSLRTYKSQGVGRNLEEQIHLGDGDIYGDSSKDLRG
ncbi:hypothetical protein Tco_0490265 [Tanacetum coccineum]